MNFLALDTTTEKLTVALSVNGNDFSYTGETQKKGHLSEVLVIVDKLLSDAKAELCDVDVFSAVVGPGSFTGIRIGVAMVNAFAYALSKKVLAVNAFQLIAFGEKDITAQIDALHGNYYGATVNGGEVLDMFYNEGEIATNLKVKTQEQTDIVNALIGTVKKTISNAAFGQIRPVYLRQSQAERDKEKAGA